MRHITKFILILLTLFTLSLGNIYAGNKDIQLFWQEKEEEELIDSLLSSMSDEEIIGQVFLLGYFGALPSPDILDWISSRNIGGVKIFGWNAEDLEKLSLSIAQMQETAGETKWGIPLLIATDQEGGWVRHVKGETSITPGNIAIGASGIPFDAYYSGYFIGIELQALGINMNFAPTVDVYINPNADVIGPRAFSDDPLSTSILSIAYYKGMEKAGLICTAKHFPGHGGADKDSHGIMPTINASMEELWDRDLLPYRFLVKEGIPAVMSGHLGFPQIIPADCPASLSSYFLHDVLRDEIGFQGVIITDDLRMNGVRQGDMTLSQICVNALDAGNDMIMLSQTPGKYDAIWQAIYNKYSEDTEFREKIRNAVRRILRLKIRYLKNGSKVNLIPDSKGIKKVIPSEEGKEYFFDLACRSVTILRDKDLPLNGAGSDKKMLITGQFNTFLQEGTNRFPDADRFYFPYTPFYSSESWVQKEIVRLSENYDTIIFCLANPNSLQILKTLKDYTGNLIVFSVLTPIYLRETSWVKNAIAVYGTGQTSFQAGFGVISGDFSAEGICPIQIFKPDE